MDKHQPPPNPGFSRMPNRQPPKPEPPRPMTSPLDKSDVVSVSGQATSGPKAPPPVIPTKLGEDVGRGQTTTVSLEDGSKIVKYAQPQKLSKLLKDAKAQVGGESSRFFGKGWVIGEGVAKISPDGMSVIYYPTDIAELVRDLLGPNSETI